MNEIPWGMFFKCSELKSVILPETITEISRYAFYDSGIETISIPEGVHKLETYCFANCARLNTVTTTTSRTLRLKEIPASAFTDCPSLTYVGPFSADNIGEFAFMNCKALTKVEIDTRDIRPYAFYGSGIKYNMKYSSGSWGFVIFGSTNIGSYAFAKCDNLKEEEITLSGAPSYHLGANAFKLENGKIKKLIVRAEPKYSYLVTEAGWREYFEEVEVGEQWVDIGIGVGDEWEF